MQPRCFFSAVYINAAVQRFPTFVACDFLSWNYASPRRESCDGYGSTPKSQACIVQTCALRIGLALSALMRRKVLNKCKCPAYSYVEGTTTEMQPQPKHVFCFLAFSQAITWLNGEEVHRWVCFLPLFPGPWGIGKSDEPLVSQIVFITLQFPFWFFVIAGLHACYDHHLKLFYLVLFFFLIHFCMEEARIKAVPKLCCHSSLIWKIFRLIHTFLWLWLCCCRPDISNADQFTLMSAWNFPQTKQKEFLLLPKKIKRIALLFTSNPLITSCWFLDTF